MSALQVREKAVFIIRSQKITVSFCPQCR